MRRPIRIFLGFSFVLTGALLLLFAFFEGSIGSFTKSAIGAFGAMWVAAGTIVILFKNFRSEFLTGLLTGLAMLNYSYIIVEGAFYVIEGFSPRGISSNKAYYSGTASYDPVCGYLWSPEKFRGIRVINGKVVYDFTFKANNLGFPSKRDYSYRKKEGVRRYMVLGDSFTAGIYLPKNWVDEMQETLEDKGEKFEFYSFSIDGGGLANWHSTFFRLIVPRFDFDGIIIAPYSDDLKRGFMILQRFHSGFYFGRFDSIPNGREDFTARYVPSMKKIIETADEGTIENIVRGGRMGLSFSPERPNLYFMKYLLTAASTVKGIYFVRTASEGRSYDISDVVDYLGEGNIAMIDDIIGYCKANGKDAYLALIPGREKAIRLNAAKALLVDMVVADVLAKHYGIKYFNGYDIFSGMGKDEIEGYYLEYDPHWNREGSALFSRRFTEYFFNTADR